MRSAARSGSRLKSASARAVSAMRLRLPAHPVFPPLVRTSKQILNTSPPRRRASHVRVRCEEQAQVFPPRAHIGRPSLRACSL